MNKPRIGLVVKPIRRKTSTCTLPSFLLCFAVVEPEHRLDIAVAVRLLLHFADEHGAQSDSVQLRQAAG